LQDWLDASGVHLPTPAAKELRGLAAAAEESKRLRKQLEALREAELELAAREAEEHERGFAMLVGWQRGVGGVCVCAASVLHSVLTVVVSSMCVLQANSTATGRKNFTGTISMCSSSMYVQVPCCLLLPCLQEEENLSLVAHNAELQQQLQELAAAAARATPAAPAAAGSPSTPASQHWMDGVQARAAVALQRAADTRRLSGAFEVRLCACVQLLLLLLC
jgi:hypothetical protein